MRILIVSEVFAPAVSGVAVTTARLAASMAARGHEVTVLTASQEGGPASRERCDGYDVIRVASLANPIRKGFRLTAFAAAAVRDAFDSVRPDIVHIQDPISLCVHAVGQARKRGIPFVATHHFMPEFVHAYLPSIPGMRPAARLWLYARLKRLYAGCVAITVPTRSVLGSLSSLGVPLRVISNGVDTGRFAPGGERATPPEILYVGRLDPEKNLPVLIEACRGLAIPYRLVMLGGGNLADSLKVRSEGLPVSWVPPVSPGSQELVEAYRRAAVFCMPSPHETESMVTLEAMACGLPVLAADGGALPELVANGKNGYLLDPNDPAQWRATIEAVLGDSHLQENMGVESRRRSLARDASATADAFEALYLEAVS